MGTDGIAVEIREKTRWHMENTRWLSGGYKKRKRKDRGGIKIG